MSIHYSKKVDPKNIMKNKEYECKTTMMMLSSIIICVPIAKTVKLQT